MGELNTVPAHEAERLRQFFLESGYSAAHVRDYVKVTEFPSRRLRNLALLQDRTSEHTLLNLLLRWFWLGSPQDERAAELAPGWFIDSCLECGLLRSERGELWSDLMLVPWEDFLIVSDHTLKIDAANPELVLWPNPTTRLLARLTIRRPARATLDLGTGNGALALAAATHSQHVVATDLNPRAVQFARFNALLNGFSNIECLAGDGFAPLQGRQFDLIVSNPPFFIKPSDEYLFCDNPLDLDQLCQRLVREAPTYLNEHGYFQMLCEWAQVRGESWEERLSGWIAGTGCDGWVMKGNSQAPSEYALERIRELQASPEHDAEQYSAYMAYYEARRVEAIHSGVVVLRRRSGNNWVRIEEMSHTPKDPFGDAVERIFLGRDFLQAHGSDEDLLAVCPRLASHARLEHTFQQEGAEWRLSSAMLRLVKGLQFSVGVQPLVADFLAACDGTRTLRELIENIAARVERPLEVVQPECLGMARTLLERGFLEWQRSSLPDNVSTLTKE